MKKVKTRWRIYALSLSLIAFFLLFLVTKHWVTLLYHEVSSSGWTKTKAQVTQFEMLSMMSHKSDRRRYHLFKPQVTYKYQWTGETYFGSKVVWNDAYESNETGGVETLYSRGMRLKRAYDSGANIDIYIDPKNPKDSIIYKDSAWSVYIVGFFSSLLVSLPFFGLVYFAFRKNWFFLR